MKYIIILLLTTNLAIAKKDKNMPQILERGSHNYLLCKEHTIKYAFVVKIAYVGLYLKDCNTELSLLDVSDKLVRFNYQVDVKAKFFVDAAEKFFLKNSPNPEDSEITQELIRFNQSYKDIQSSDFYDLYHKQGNTLTLSKNNEELGKSLNADFASRYFNIWFGNKPAIKPLKKSFIK